MLRIRVAAIGAKFMTVTIRQVHPVFAGEVAGVDLRQPLTPEDVSAIEAGMDRYAVLVFHDQNITDDQQANFSRNFGVLERPGAQSNITKEEDRRLGPDMADISNLDRDNNLLGRGTRERK